MDTETQNPFQATFSPSNPPAAGTDPGTREAPPANSPTGKTGRRPRNPPAAGKKSTRSTPITRPRKTASKKASTKKTKRGRPAKVASAAPAVGGQANPPAVKRGRKPRVTNGLKIELGAAMNAMAGLKQEDATLLGQIVTELLKKPKGARTRIIGALGKVLA